MVFSDCLDTAGLWPIPKGCEISISDRHDQDYLCIAWSSIDKDVRHGLLADLESKRNSGDIEAYLHFLDSVQVVVGKAPKKAKTKPKKSAAAKSDGNLPHPALSIPYPRDMTRCSPFFPVPYIRRTEQAKVLPYLNDWPLSMNSWGTLTYKGPTLTTAHEDLLLALLAMIVAPSRINDPEKTEQALCRYEGSLRELLIATGTKRPNGQEYEDAFDQLADLAGAVVSVLNTKGRRITFSSLITGGRRDAERFRVDINPEFVRAYKEGQITYQSLQLRSKIKSLVGRSLYRFVAGQPGGWKGRVAVLCGALNIANDRDGRKKLRRAIEELIDLKILKKGSGLNGTMALLIS